MVGLIIGAVFTQLVSWRWIFIFNALVAIPTSVICFLVIPQVRPSRTSVTLSAPSSSHSGAEKKDIEANSLTKPLIRLDFAQKLKVLDIPGIFLLTSAILLFIFAVVSGSSKKWDSARVLAPLIVSGALLSVFLFYESRIKRENAILSVISLCCTMDTKLDQQTTGSLEVQEPYSSVLRLALPLLLVHICILALYYFVAGLLALEPYHDFRPSVCLHSSYLLIHFFNRIDSLPVGVTCFLAFFVAVGYLLEKHSARNVILFGGAFLIPGTILYTRVRAHTSHYWRYQFPGMIIGTFGNVFVFLAANVGIIASAPPEQSGVAGAIFNAGLQMGAAMGASVISTIQQSVDKKHEKKNAGEYWKGREAAYWFTTACIIVLLFAVVVFFRSPDVLKKGEEEDKEASVADGNGKAAKSIV